MRRLTRRWTVAITALHRHQRRNAQAVTHMVITITKMEFNQMYRIAVRRPNMSGEDYLLYHPADSHIYARTREGELPTPVIYRGKGKRATTKASASFPEVLGQDWAGRMRDCRTHKSPTPIWPTCLLVSDPGPPRFQRQQSCLVNDLALLGELWWMGCLTISWPSTS